MHCRSLLLFSFSVCLLIAFSVHQADARVMMLDNPTRMEFSGFGAALAIIGDINEDDTPDYLVGAYNQRVGENDRQGQAFIYSGSDGKLLLTIDNPEPQSDAIFSYAVAAPGDINGDQTPDMLISAFGQKGSGQAFAFSGKDGKLLYTVQAPEPQLGGGFGWSLAVLDDLTNDGVVEFVAGAFAQDGNGKAFIFNGQNGELVRTLAPQSTDEWAFGWSVAGSGDLNKDGTGDILVSAPYSMVDDRAVQGRVLVFSGRDGSLIRTIDSPEPNAGATFGWHVISNGDINKDGVPDILVGAPYQDIGNTTAQGIVFALSGADNALLFTLNNPAPTKRYSGFGLTITRGPDVDQDGVSEILVGAPYQTVDQFHVQGEVFVFNGRDGRHLVTFDNPYAHQGSMFGYTIASPGDLNDDDIPEFVFGASGQSIMDKSVVGRVYVFMSDEL